MVDFQTSARDNMFAASVSRASHIYTQQRRQRCHTTTTTLTR